MLDPSDPRWIEDERDRYKATAEAAAAHAAEASDLADQYKAEADRYRDALEHIAKGGCIFAIECFDTSPDEPENWCGSCRIAALLGAP